MKFKEYKDPWTNLEINLDALVNNYRSIKKRCKKDFYAVLKSDAYGHGLVECSKSLSSAGCRLFAVESPHEGIILRNEGIVGEILIMNPIPEWMADLTVRHELSPSVVHPSILKPLNEAAVSMNLKCKVHLNVNIGLNRLGIPPSKVIKVAKEINKMEHLIFYGIFGQPRDPESAQEAYRKLIEIYQKLKESDLGPKLLHFANSTTFLTNTETLQDIARIGILLYGVVPPEQYGDNFDVNYIEPVMSLETEIVQILDLPRGSKIGYRSKSKTETDLKIGVIPIGYYQGLDRKLSKTGNAAINGNKVSFIGPISMNSSTINITGLSDVEIGDKVTLIGKKDSIKLDVNDAAHTSGTIAGELLTRFGKSIPRNYKSNDAGNQKLDDYNKPDGQHVKIKLVKTEKDLPVEITSYMLASFIYDNVSEYKLDHDTIVNQIDYSLSSDKRGGGFVILAYNKSVIHGVIVILQSEKIAAFPEYSIAYICSDEPPNKQDIFKLLISSALRYTDGMTSIFIKSDDPAVPALKDMGFSVSNIEMSVKKED